MGGRVFVQNQDLVIKGLRNLLPKEQQRLQAVSDYAINLLYARTMEKASLEDHTLEQLRNMGYPYAKYFRSKEGVTPRAEDSGPHPDEFVHIQSGLLTQNIEKYVGIRDGKLVIMVAIHKSKVPYIHWLIEGTEVMRPRDFLGHTWKEVGPDIIALVKGGVQPGKGSRGTVK